MSLSRWLRAVGEQAGLHGGIADPAVCDHEARGGSVRIGLLARPEDVEHGKAIYRQAVGDEAPMAAPPGQLSAHDRAGSQPSELLERLDAAFEVRGQHVIGIAAKAGVLPCAI